MKNDLTCAVAADLLPSYADGLTSAETNEAVRRHLDGCPACSDRYRAMTAPGTPERAGDKQEIAFLKKVKKKHIRSAVCVALAVLLLAGGVFGGLYAKRVYEKSPVTHSNLMDLVTEVSEDGKEVILRGQLAEGLTLAAGGDTAFDPAAGKLTFTLYSRRARTHDSNVVYEVFRTSDTVKSIYLDHVPLWDNGTAISERIGRVYAAAHPYMGAMPENAVSAEALGIGKTFGPFTNELTTSTQPYVWAMTFENPITELNDAEIQTELTLDAILLLATIGNLDGMEVYYTLPDENGGTTERKISLTTDDADALVGMSVKEAGKTAAGLQELQRTYLQHVNTVVIDSFIITTAEGTHVSGFHTEIP